MRVADRAHDRGDTRRLLERRKQLLAVTASNAARAPGATCCERLERALEIGGEPGDGSVAGGDPLREQPAQLRNTVPGARRDDREGKLRHAVLGEEALHVLAPCSHVGRAEQVGLVEDDRHGRRVRRQWAQVAVVERGVRVLLRLDDPENEVGERDDPLGLDAVRRLDRVEVGQVEQDEPAEAVGVHLVSPSDLEPVEERVRTAAPDRRLAGRGRRPPPADRRKLGPREHVEERRLADACRSGEGDDGRLEAEPEPRSRLRDDGTRFLDVVLLQPPLGELGRLPERREAVVELRGSRRPTDRVHGGVQASEAVRLGRGRVEQLVEPLRLGA